MANGQPALAPPDLGGMSPEEWLQQRERAAGIGTGGQEEVQPPPAPEGYPTTLGGVLGRYARAGAIGAGETAAVALPIEAAIGPVGWASALPTVGFGALGGAIEQGVEDYRAFHPDTNIPSWAGPVAGTVVGLGAGGARAIGHGAVSLGGRLASAIGAHPLPSSIFGAGALTSAASLADHIVSGAAHLLPSASSMGLPGMLTGAGGLVAAGIRDLVRNPKSVSRWVRPIATTMGAAGTEATNNALSYSAPDSFAPPDQGGPQGQRNPLGP